MPDCLDKMAYAVKAKMPVVFEAAAAAGRVITVLLYGRAIRDARRVATIQGSIRGQQAVMRVLWVEDLEFVEGMFAGIRSEHLHFFHPHGFDRRSLASVLGRRDIMTYGLFADEKLCAYAILKLFPTRKAYIGRLVSPAMAGLGIGRFLSRYLYWQSRLLGFQPCSTIHEKNLASLKSHAAVRPYKVAAELPNGFRLIRFELLPEDAMPPVLRIE